MDSKCIEMMLSKFKKDTGFVFSSVNFIRNDKIVGSGYNIGKSGTYKTEQYIKGIYSGGNYPLSPGCAMFRLKTLRKKPITKYTK